MSLRGEFVKLISLKSLSGEPVESRIKSGMTKQRKKINKTCWILSDIGICSPPFGRNHLYHRQAGVLAAIHIDNIAIVSYTGI